MIYFKASLTLSRLIAALFISTLLVACGGSGSSAPGTSSLTTTLTTASSSYVTGAIASDTTGNWTGNFGSGSTLITALGAASISSASVVSSSSPSTIIIPLTVIGYTFSASGNLTSSQYNALVAAGSAIIVKVVDSNGTSYTTAVTRS